MRKTRVSALTLGLITALSACTQSQSSKPQGYVSHTNDRWTSSVITTCFEQDGFTLDKATVSKAVTTEFARAGFAFTGWEKCTDEDKADLRIQFLKESAGSQVVTFGNGLAGLPNGVVLGLSHACLNEYSGSHCQSNIALHEFGHAMGLHHEMNRQDDVDCRYQQTLDRAGESDATQIGDFDANSIMNYCKVFEANDKDEYLGLSEQDVATLKARYSSPQAQLKTHAFHILKDSAEFPGKVEGHRVTQYRYKIALTENSDCKNSVGYSEPTGIDVEIPRTSLDELPRNRSMRLCLIGGDKDNNWQSLEHYTSKDFVLMQDDGSQPLPLKSASLSTYGKDYIKLDVNLTEPLPSALVFADLGQEERPSVQVDSEMKLVISKDEKTLSLLFHRGRLLRDNGTYYIKSLSISSKLYKGVYLMADTAETPLTSLGSDKVTLPNAKLILTDGFVNKNQAPTVRALSMETPRTDYATQHYLNLTVDTDTDINDVVLDFALDGDNSGRVFNLYSSDIYPMGQGKYRVALDKSALIYKGQYRLQSLRVYDYFRNETQLNVASTDATIPGTSSAVPELLNVTGYPLDARAPALKDVIAPEVFDVSDFSASLQVTVKVDAEIPVVDVWADFTGTHLNNRISELFTVPFFSKPQGDEIRIQPYSVYYMQNDVYRLTSIKLVDAGQNEVKIEIGPDDLVIPGTTIPVPSFKIMGGQNPKGPDLRSVKIDATTYKKGDTLQVRLTTTAEQPLTEATVMIRSKTDPDFELEVNVENPSGAAETLVSIPIDDRFKSSEEYVIGGVYAFDGNFEMVSLSLFLPDEEFYWNTKIRPLRFTVL